MDNITMEKTEKTEKEVPSQQPQQPDLNNLVIADENTALNVMVSFLHMAQKRGAFNIQESAKAWECIQMFMKRQ
jgi:hypothetical protein